MDEHEGTIINVHGEGKDFMNLDEIYRGSIVNGVFVTESKIEEPHKVLRKISAKKSMNSNLMAVKESLVKQAKKLGADAVIKFEYGQKKSFWTASGDDAKYYGRGEAIKLTEAK